MLEVSAAIISNGSEILCFQKGASKRSYLSYKFEFPGGKLEQDETPKDALIRELREELDLDVEKCKMALFAVLTHDYSDFSVRVHYFLVECTDPEYILKEHIAAVWKTKESLSQLDWVDADKDAVNLLSEGA